MTGCGRAALSKEKTKIDLWLKDIAPSDDLRKWYGHEPGRWPEFKVKYRDELASCKGFLEELKRLESEYKTITLVYAAKDENRNNAVVLRENLSDTST